jgi:hypothetical protein
VAASGDGEGAATLFDHAAVRRLIYGSQFGCLSKGDFDGIPRARFNLTNEVAAGCLVRTRWCAVTSREHRPTL